MASKVIYWGTRIKNFFLPCPALQQAVNNLVPIHLFAGAVHGEKKEKKSKLKIPSWGLGLIFEDYLQPGHVSGSRASSSPYNCIWRTDQQCEPGSF